MAECLCQPLSSPFCGVGVLPHSSLPRLHGLRHCFISHDADCLLHNLQLLVAELLVAAGLRSKCHGGSGMYFCELVWSGAQGVVQKGQNMG